MKKARRSVEGEEGKYNIAKLRLVPILERGERPIALVAALRRGRENPATDYGKRFAKELCVAGNAGRISAEVFPRGVYVLCPRGSRRDSGGFGAWRVIRNDDDRFCCDYVYFRGGVGPNGRFACCDE